MANILIIEDDATLGGLLAQRLQELGYEVTLADDGPRGLERAAGTGPDLIILDVMLPGMDGWEVLENLRRTQGTPVLMLTAKNEQPDVLRGLQMGADDYVKKPFDLRELELRIQALLRRAHGEPPGPGSVYDDGVLRIDADRRIVSRRGQPLHLTPTEFRLLCYLVAHPERPVPHAELLRAVWGPQYIDDTAILSVYIRYLREKLEDTPAEPAYIRTEWGAGYRFVRGRRENPGF